MLTSDAKALLDWYERAKRRLPWRENTDPYAVLVSEVMLQQTTVAAVIPKYEEWMKRFPTVEALADSPIEEVLGYWSGLGYYQRARRLHATAGAVTRLGGFPNDCGGLLELPGIGPYTAAAVASICFERPVLAIDTNVVRTLFRYYALQAPPQDRAALKKIKSAVEPVLEWVSPGDFNQALMELGAGLCSITEASCLLCPLREGCRARQLPGGPEQLPLSPPRKEVKETRGVALVLTKSGSGESLLLQGTSLGLLSDLFQPPLLFSESNFRASTRPVFDADPSGPSSPAVAYGPPVQRVPADSTDRQHQAEFYDSSTRGSLDNETGRLCEQLAHLLELSMEDSVGELSYGISGRKLKLNCFQRLLDDQAVGEVERLLDASEARRLWWHPAQREPKPVSTLTRRILAKVPESSRVARPSAKKN